MATLHALPVEILIHTLIYVGQPDKTASVSKTLANATKASFFYLRKAYENTETLKNYCHDSSNLSDIEIVKAVYSKILGETMKVGKKPSPWNVFRLEQIAKETNQKEKDLLKIVSAIEKQYPQIPAYTGPRSGKELEEQAGKWMSDNAKTFKAVTLLDLMEQNLQFLSPVISKLTNLKKLWLSWNYLQSIPSELGNLKNLQELWLDNNQLQSIPSELSKLINLQKLWLYRNPLQSIPSEITSLPNLKIHK